MSTRGWESATMADVTKREIRMPQKGRSKYGATKVTVDGITFDSKAEARRYSELLLFGLAGYVRNLELQPRFPLFASRVGTYHLQQEPPTLVGAYVADFRYERRDYVDGPWEDVIEDVKGVRTPVYRLKKKLVEALYGIQITEVR